MASSSSETIVSHSLETEKPETTITETTTTASSAPESLASNSEASDHQSQEKISDQSHEPDCSAEGGGEGEAQEEEEEEEGECGFCLFMKGGGCKESFTAWEKCVEEAEKNQEDVVEKCFQATSMLKKCMDAHADYYEPILRAEKVAEEEALKELEKKSSDLEKEEKH